MGKLLFLIWVFKPSKRNNPLSLHLCVTSDILEKVVSKKKKKNPKLKGGNAVVHLQSSTALQTLGTPPPQSDGN